MREFIKKYVDPIVPIYAIIPFIFFTVYNGFVYFGSQQIAQGFHHHDLTNSIDEDIPFVSTFVIMYCFWYIFYIVNYVLIAKEGKEKYFKFFVADFIAKTVSFCIFIFYPTTMNLRPAFTGHTIFGFMVQIIYNLDPPTNLLPSIHCLVSWFCFIGISSSKKIPRWYKIISFITAILIILSTLLVKQHVILDAVTGVVLAEISYLIGIKTKLYEIPMRFFDSITNKVFYKKKQSV